MDGTWVEYGWDMDGIWVQYELYGWSMGGKWVKRGLNMGFWYLEEVFG